MLAISNGKKSMAGGGLGGCRAVSTQQDPKASVECDSLLLS